jgi:L-gulonate 3-dehydrogenase
MMEKIALVGAGLVGQAWAIVFSRAGHPVSLYDTDPAALPVARANIETRLADLAAAGLIDDAAAVLGRISTTDDLAEALSGADHVQESTPERVAIKRQVFSQLDRLAPPQTVLASSTSGIPASAFTENLAGRARCLVAHPINPPFVTPLVELCPAPWTDPALVDRTHALMSRVGQMPIRLRREVEGFIANRLQGALLSSAFKLFEDGYASAEDIDIAIKHGLGLRWSFMGPFETIDLNAPDGLAGYVRALGPLYESIERSQCEPRPWSAELAAKVHAERRERLPADQIGERAAWRDRRLIALAAHRAHANDEIGE